MTDIAGSQNRIKLWLPGGLFLLSLLFLLARVLMATNANMMNDEYYHAKTAYLWFTGEINTRHITSLPGRGEAGFPDSLFFAIYKVCYYFGSSFYVAAKLLNVIFAALMGIGVFTVAKRFLEPRMAMGIAILSLWLPPTSYFSYFVPEALYECLIWAGLAGFFALADTSIRRAAALLGIAFGAALLAKPNAAALMLAANAMVAVVTLKSAEGTWQIRPMISSLVVLNAAFLGSAYLLNVVLTGGLAWDPVGKFYETGLSRVGEVQVQKDFLLVFATYGAACLLAIGLLLGPALLVLVSGAPRADRSRRDLALWLMSALGLAVLLLGTAKVGTNWERVYENHTGVYSTRYISVIFPLVLIACFRFLPEAIKSRRIRALAGVLIVLFTAGLGFVFRNMENTFQMREVFWTRGIGSPVYAAMVLCLLGVTLYYALHKRPSSLPYKVLLGGFALLSSAALARQDVWWSNHGPERWYSDVANSLTHTIPLAERDNGLIITEANHRAARFMFQFPGIDSLVVTRDFRNVRPVDIPASTSWVLFLGDQDPQFHPACVRMQAATYCPLKTFEPAASL